MNSKNLNKYLVFYFITAQYIFTSKRSCCKYLKWLPLIVHFGIICVCLHILNVRKYMIYAQVGSISELFTLITVLPHIFMIIANIRTNKTMQNILKMMIKLHTDMEKQFGDTFNCVAFTRRHNFKIFFLICIFILSSTFRTILQGTVLTQRIDAAFNTMHFFRTTFLLYFLLHIDLLYSVLEFFNANILKMASLHKLSDIQYVDTLHYVSFVHRKIWKSTKAIENCFGWILLFLLLKYFTDVLNSAYWTFSYFNEGANVIRK